MKKYQIFISYRRDGGEGLAGRLTDRFTSMGYQVFFDVESMRSGSFNTQLLDAIAACNDVLLILPPNALDRCSDPNDWVRQELEHAIKLKKNIIPILMRGFEFPSQLPPQIDQIRYMQGVAASMEYYDSMIDRIESYLVSKPQRSAAAASRKKAVKAAAKAMQSEQYTQTPPLQKPTWKIPEEVQIRLRRNLRKIWREIEYRMDTILWICGGILLLGFLISHFTRGPIFDFFRIVSGQVFHTVDGVSYGFAGIGFLAGFAVILMLSYVFESTWKEKFCHFILIASIISMFACYYVGVNHSDCVMIEDGQIFMVEPLDNGYSLQGVSLKKGQTVVNIPSEFNGKPVLEIGQYCFYNKYTIRQIHVPEGVLRIQDSAMMGASGLEQLDLPASLVWVAPSAFQQSGSIVINFGGTQEQWENIYQKGWLTGELTIHYQ